MELWFSGWLQLGWLPANTVKDIQKSKEVAKQQAAKVAASLPKQQLSGFDSPLDVWVRGAIPWTTVNSKPVTLGRLNPKTPEVDDAIMGAVYGMTSGASPSQVLEAFPELTDKWDAIMNYVTDVQDLEADDKTLYDLYPELSPKVKTTIRSQLKTQLEEMNAQAELEADPLTGWENAKAFWLGVAQWVGNVWYNISWGKQINTLGDYVWEKLKDTKFAKKVKQLAIDTFGADEVSKFENQETLRKAGANANSVENNANILRQVWGRKMEQSSAAWYGKATGEFLAEAAVTAPLGWLASAGTKAALWLGKWALWAAARGAIAWGITWAAWAEVSTIWSKGRLATKDELKAGIITWAITWAILRKQFMPSKKDITNTILPKMTGSELEQRWLRNGLGTSKTGKIIAVLSDDEKDMVKLAEKYIDPSKTNVWNLNKATSIVDSEAKKLRWILKNSDFVWDTDSVISKMDDIDTPDILKSDATLANAFKLTKERFRAILDKAPKTAEGLLDARQEFDAIVRKSYPNLYTNETLTPIKIAITSLREIPNEVLNSGIADDVVKNSLRTQTLTMRLRDNLATKLEEFGSTTASRFLKKNKELLKVWGLLVWGAVWSRAIDSAGQTVAP